MKILSTDNIRPGTVKIFLNDVEISKECFYAEAPDSPYRDGDGLVKVFVFTSRGNIDVDANGDLKTEVKTGRVRWEPITEQSS